MQSTHAALDMVDGFYHDWLIITNNYVHDDDDISYAPHDI